MKANQLLSEFQYGGRSQPITPEGLDALKLPIDSERTGGMVSHKLLVRLILARQLRSNLIGSDLFADPAWDMLLALYAADLADERLNAAEICSAAGVPLTTAQRWLTVLEERGLVRTGSPLPSGTVTLSPSGSSVMSRYFSAVSTTILPF